MTHPRRRAGLAAALALVVAALAGCSESTPTAAPSASATDSASSRAKACAAVVDEIVTATQQYVDTYGPLPVGGSASPTPSAASTAGPDGDFKQALADAQRNLTDLGCDVAAAQTDLAAGLGRVTARGPVATAVLLQTKAAITGRLPKDPVKRTVSPADDLAVALSEAPSGSTITLRAGTYTLEDALVLLTGVTLKGAGRDTTLIRSPGADATVLVLTGDRVTLTGLAVAHTGSRPASVLLGGPDVSLALTGVRLSGARADAQGQGGAGVLLSARGTATTTATATTLEMTGVDVTGNGAAGVVLAGNHRVSILTSQFRANGQCGVCFLDASSGSVQGSTFTANAVGVVATGSARPTLIANTFTGGQVGVQASGSSVPVLSRNTMSRMARAAIILTGPVTGRIDGTVCRAVKFGIVLSPTSLPDLGTNSCTVARSKT
ncbi:MAG: right-handed parallel beta-helix repeat-containing protein [Actinomycetales bacterium]|nr:right-handed parallel beta-helix repeat-containing protein [Actinomycetales bacterium]